MAKTQRDEPYLPTEAVRQIKRLHAESGVVVHPSAVALLMVLCDKVSAKHGQWYGSWEKLANEHPWSRRWFFKWRDELEALGFLVKLPGKRWQLMPWLYEKCTPVHVLNDREKSGEISVEHDRALCECTDVEEKCTPEQEKCTPVLAEHKRTLLEQGLEHSSYDALGTERDINEEISEASKEKQRKLLEEVAKKWYLEAASA